MRTQSPPRTYRFSNTSRTRFSMTKGSAQDKNRSGGGRWCCCDCCWPCPASSSSGASGGGNTDDKDGSNQAGRDDGSADVGVVSVTCRWSTKRCRGHGGLSSSRLPLPSSSSPRSHHVVTPPPTTTAPILASCRAVVLEAMPVDVGRAWVG